MKTQTLITIFLQSVFFFIIYFIKKEIGKQIVNTKYIQDIQSFQTLLRVIFPDKNNDINLQFTQFNYSCIEYNCFWYSMTVLIQYHSFFYYYHRFFFQYHCFFYHKFKSQLFKNLDSFGIVQQKSSTTRKRLFLLTLSTQTSDCGCNVEQLRIVLV